MLPSNNIQSIVGATLYGRDKAKIGRIDQVLVDASAGHPTWALLHGGIFGRKKLFVPLEDATWEHDDVFVGFDKDDVKNAPHPDAEGGLSPAEEQELRSYYAGAADRTADATRTRVVEEDRAGDSDTHRDTDADTDTDGPKHLAESDPTDIDERVLLVQERLVVRTEQVPVARVDVDAIEDADPDVRHGANQDATAAPTPAPGTDTDPDDNRPGPDRVVI